MGERAHTTGFDPILPLCGFAIRKRERGRVFVWVNAEVAERPEVWLQVLWRDTAPGGRVMLDENNDPARTKALTRAVAFTPIGRFDESGVAVASRLRLLCHRTPGRYRVMREVVRMSDLMARE